MPGIHLELSGDHEAIGRRAGTAYRYVVHTTADWTLDALEHGMVSGATSLMLMIPCVIEGVDALVMAETSLQCWMMAAAGLAGKFHDEVTRPGWSVMSSDAKALIVPRWSEAIRRAIPGATDEQADDAARMMVDALGADRP